MKKNAILFNQLHRFFCHSITGFSLVILLTPSVPLFAQNICEEPPVLPEFSLTFPPLCQRYHFSTFPNQWGGANKQKASQIIAQNGGSHVFTGDIELLADFEIDDEFTLMNCKVNIAPNVKITVNQNIMFTLDGSKLFACNGMWNGIKLKNNSNMVSLNITEIEDATIAMEAPCGERALFSLTQTIFNRNNVGIKVDYHSNAVPTSCASDASVFLEFAGNVFNCTSPLNGTTNGVTFVGIQIYKGGGSIGSTSAEENVFTNIKYGIRFESQENWASTAILNCRFERIKVDGIFAKNGQLRIRSCHFVNCVNSGINTQLTNGLNVGNCEFILDDGIKLISVYPHWHYGIYIGFVASGSSITISDNSFTAHFFDEYNHERAFMIWVNHGEMGGGGRKMLIEHNNIEMIGYPPTKQGATTSGYGIRIIAAFFSSEETIINENNFYINQLESHPYPGIPNAYWGVEMMGIYIDHPRNVSITYNVFNSAGPKGTSDNPIFMTGIDFTQQYMEGNKVIGNVLMDDPQNEDSENFYEGIYTRDVINVFYCSNVLRECVALMDLYNNCQGTQLYNNYFEVAIGGLQLSPNSFIGEQGVEGGQHNKNHWFDEAGTTTFPNNHAFNPNQDLGPLSRIWANTSESTYVNNLEPPQYQYFSEYYPARTFVDDWFKKDLSGVVTSAGCNGVDLPRTDFSDKVIAEGLLPNYSQDPYLLWASKRYLYGKLYAYPDLINDAPCFASFINNESTTAIGKLNQVHYALRETAQFTANEQSTLSGYEETIENIFSSLSAIDATLHTSNDPTALTAAKIAKIQQIQYLSNVNSLAKVFYNNATTALITDLMAVIALNNQVSPTNVFEQNEKTLISIFLNGFVYQNGILTAGQIAQLEAIASYCPEEAGPAASFARIYLGNMCGNPYPQYRLDPDHGCHPDYIPADVVIPIERGQEHQNLAEGQLYTYPNPTSEDIFIRFASDQRPVKISITDCAGLVKFQSNLADLGFNGHVPLNLPSGAYFCQVTWDSGEISTCKFLVVK